MTAARGFVASGVDCGIGKSGLDLALVRSTVPATGAALFTANRVQAAPVKISKEHLALAEPQAVVANSGNANAATGLRGELDARATAAETARLLDLDAEQVLVLSTGVIGLPLRLDLIRAGLPEAAAALAPEGGDDAAGAIMTTDTRPKQAVVARDGFTVGGMAKGSGMIHPNLATMLAVVTTDYPLDAGEAHAFLHAAVEESFNAISVDGECSTNDTVVLLANGESGVTRTAATDAAFAESLQAVCGELASQIVADGEGATFLAAIDVRGAVDRAQAKAVARRIATSPLVKTALFGRDANWGRVLAAAGSAPHNGGYANVDPDLLTLIFNGSTVIDHGTPQGVEPDLDGSECRIELDLGLGDGEASYLTSDLSYDYVRINADYRSVKPVVVKCGGAVASEAVALVRPFIDAGHPVCVVHGAGPQISAEMERRGLEVEFVGGRRVTTPEALEVVRESMIAVNAAVCAAIGPRAVGLLGDEIGLVATRAPGLGEVGDPVPSAPPAVLEALAAGKVPVVAPLAAGPLNVNADEAASALAIGLGAERILFLTDVPGLLLAGAVVSRIAADDAVELLDGGTLQGGIQPKLRAAVTAARLGVQAEIGQTAVVA